MSRFYQAGAQHALEKLGGFGSKALRAPLLGMLGGGTAGALMADDKDKLLGALTGAGLGLGAGHLGKVLGKSVGKTQGTQAISRAARKAHPDLRAGADAVAAAGKMPHATPEYVQAAVAKAREGMKSINAAKTKAPQLEQRGDMIGNLLGSAAGTLGAGAAVRGLSD